MLMHEPGVSEERNFRISSSLCFEVDYLTFRFFTLIKYLPLPVTPSTADACLINVTKTEKTTRSYTLVSKRKFRYQIFVSA